MNFNNYDSEEDFLTEATAFANDYVAKHASEIDELGVLPPGINSQLAQRRLFALTSLNSDKAALSIERRYELLLDVIETLGRVSASVAKLVLDQNFGQVPMFQKYATRDLVDEYLPKIQAGTIQLAFLMTEPQAGSSHENLLCTARKTDGGYLLNGKKDWITGAMTRSLYLVVARSEVDSSAFGVFLINKDEERKSIVVSEKKQLLGLRGIGEHTVEFNDVFVAEDNVIISPSRSAIQKVMKHYNLKRCGQAAIAIGIASAALGASYNFLKDRYPSGDERLAFQSADFACADMYCWLQASRELNKSALIATLSGDDTGVPCSVAKLVATESAVKITNNAIQLCGAAGTWRKLPLERFMRDARMLTIAGGTSDVQKLTIAKHLSKILSAPNLPH